MLLKKNVINYLKYNFSYSLPYITFDYIDETGIYYLADTYFGFCIFSDSFKKNTIIKQGVTQKTYLKNNGNVMCVDSFIPGRGRDYINIESFKNNVKQIFIPGNLSKVGELTINMNTAVEKYIPIYKNGRDVKRDDLFGFFRHLGCAIDEYDSNEYIRKHINIKLELKENDNNSPLFTLNGIPISVFTAKLDPKLLFRDFSFVTEDIFHNCNFILNNAIAHVRDGKTRELCSFIFIGDINEKVINYFNNNDVVLQVEGWKTPIILLNSFPMGIVFKEFFARDKSIIERIVDEKVLLKNYDQRVSQRNIN